MAILLTDQAMGETVVTGGWSITGNGDGSSRGANEVCFTTGDPSATLGITHSSSVYGPGGDFSPALTGSQSLEITLAGFKISLGYDGTVSSSVSLDSQGSASSSAYVGATAAGISTGNGAYDIFGAADLSTEGYLNGKGAVEAFTKGSSNYTVAKIGTQSEVWGDISGESSLKLQGLASNALAGTGGSKNGLHTDSRATSAINGVTSSSTSQITSYASVINNARANVSSSGTGIGGAWDSTFIGTKSRLGNENVSSRVTGELGGYTEANGNLDAGDVSAVLNARASRNPELSVSGGPATYASSYQSSGASRTYSETWANKAIWGSVAKSGRNRMALEWGNISKVASGAISFVPDAGATSFSKVLMDTNFTSQGITRARGNMVLSTFAEVTKNKNAVAGTVIGRQGEGYLAANDDLMTNIATFTGGIIAGQQDLFHFSYVKPIVPEVSTYNIVGRATVNSKPRGSELIIQPYFVSTELDPNIAWSRTEGAYNQSH